MRHNNDMTNQEFIAEATAEVAANWAIVCPNKPLPRVVSNSRLRTTAGRARLRDQIIEINPHLYARIEAADRRNTTLHEMAHLAAFNNYGSIHGGGHGAGWKRTMRALGLNPDRCHDYDCAGLERRALRHACLCQCGTVHQLTTRKRNHITNGTGRIRCLVCRNYLTRDQLQ